jgi:hypothetical protein
MMAHRREAPRHLDEEADADRTGPRPRPSARRFRRLLLDLFRPTKNGTDEPPPWHAPRVRERAEIDYVLSLASVVR